MNEMVTRGQYDALYIFAKMKADGAFVYVAHPIPLNISANPYEQGGDTFKCKNYETSLNKFEKILKDETLQALDKTAQDYEAKLTMFANQYPGLVQFKTSIVRDLEEAHQKVFPICTTASEQDEQQHQPETIDRTRQSVKLKALANRHAEYRGSRKILTAVDLQKYSESD